MQALLQLHTRRLRCSSCGHSFLPVLLLYVADAMMQLKITSLEKQLADAEKRSHQLFHQKVTASQEASRREKALQARVQELEAQLATGEQ